jgi:hypothetical protein
MFEPEALTRIQRFARAMTPSIPVVEEALPDLISLLRASGRPYRIVGGVAVVHHGYVRATQDVDVLVTAEHGLDALLETFGFSREGATRLRHRSGTPIDLLIAGQPSPRPGEAPYPEPDTLVTSPDSHDVVGLPGLIALKLAARRAQDRADIVALLTPLDDAAYLVLEASLPAPRRAMLVSLRDEALEELAMARAAGAS